MKDAKALSEYKVDRTGWPPGPWDGEPDRIECRDKATGLPCLMLRNLSGAWCGYVGLPPGHKHHGAGYDDVDASVHGGLTYAGECRGNICHVHREGEPAEVWWLGFDCDHYMDLAPGHLALSERYGMPSFAGYHEVYRDAAYVRAEVTRLAGQLGTP